MFYKDEHCPVDSFPFEKQNTTHLISFSLLLPNKCYFTTQVHKTKTVYNANMLYGATH